MNATSRVPVFAALLLMLLAPGAFAQVGHAASAKQKKSLEALVQSLALRMELHIPSVSSEKVQRSLRSALANQDSGVVKEKLQRLLRDNLAKDLDARRDEYRLLERDVVTGFGLELPALSVELVPADGKSNKQARVSRRRYLWVNVMDDHRSCLRHRAKVIESLEEIAGMKLDSAQRNGLKDLSEHYSEVIARALGVDDGLRQFEDLLESALVCGNTELAMMSTVSKTRTLLRPLIYRTVPAKDLATKLKAEELVEERIRGAFSEARWWPQLKQDHADMLIDPKGTRRALKERGR